MLIWCLKKNDIFQCSCSWMLVSWVYFMCLLTTFPFWIIFPFRLWAFDLTVYKSSFDNSACIQHLKYPLSIYCLTFKFLGLIFSPCSILNLKWSNALIFISTLTFVICLTRSVLLQNYKAILGFFLISYRFP